MSRDFKKGRRRQDGKKDADVSKTRGKTVIKMTKHGLVEQDLSDGDVRNISKRIDDARFDSQSELTEVQSKSGTRDIRTNIADGVNKKAPVSEMASEKTYKEKILRKRQREIYRDSGKGAESEGAVYTPPEPREEALKEISPPSEEIPLPTEQSPVAYSETENIPKGSPFVTGDFSSNTHGELTVSVSSVDDSDTVETPIVSPPRAKLTHNRKMSKAVKRHKISNLRMDSPHEINQNPVVTDKKHSKLKQSYSHAVFADTKVDEPVNPENQGDASGDIAIADESPDYENDGSEIVNPSTGKRSPPRLSHDSIRSKQIKRKNPPNAEKSGASTDDTAQANPDEKAVAANGVSAESPKISKLEHRVEGTANKLDIAKGKLPTKRKLRLERAFDEESGKGKTRLVFEEEVKSQKEHLKGSLPMRPVKLGANAVIVNAHRKIYQVEHENVGTKAAHRSELVLEGVARSAIRHNKTAPYKRVRALETKVSKQSAKLSYERVLHDNPKLRKNPAACMWQKRRIKRQYAKAAREAKKAEQKSVKAKSIGGKLANLLISPIKKNPKVAFIILALFLVIYIVATVTGLLASVGGSNIGAIFATSYLAEEQEIEAASLAYNEWEMDLLLEILGIEDNPAYQDYDEYRYNTGDISHSPFELIAYLTATKFSFTYGDIEAELQSIFAEQYQLTITPSVETKYIEQESTNADGETVTTRIPYDWHVLTITLTARNFSDVIYTRMSDGQRQHYGFLMQTLGQRQVVGNPFDFGWAGYITSAYGYRIHPIDGGRDLHRAVDIGAPLGTEILAGFDGAVSFAGNNGGYGNVVILKGEKGIEARYAHMNSIAVTSGQSIKKGDVIGTVGNTGNSTGAHLHMEVLRNGQYLNPIFFVDIGDYDFNNPSLLPPNASRPPMSDNAWNAMIAEAERHLGKPYVFGANGPNAFDCSSYVSWVLRESGVRDVGRQTAQGLFNLSSKVSGTPEPGDLVFFHSTYSTPNLVTHVGIFAGFDTSGRPVMIHAGSPIQYSYLDGSYWQSHFLAYGRIG